MSCGAPKDGTFHLMAGLLRCRPPRRADEVRRKRVAHGGQPTEAASQARGRAEEPEAGLARIRAGEPEPLARENQGVIAAEDELVTAVDGATVHQLGLQLVRPEPGTHPPSEWPVARGRMPKEVDDRWRCRHTGQARRVGPAVALGGNLPS